MQDGPLRPQALGIHLAGYSFMCSLGRLTEYFGERKFKDDLAVFIRYIKAARKDALASADAFDGNLLRGGESFQKRFFGVRLLQALQRTSVETHLVVSKWGARTLVHETPYTLEQVEQMAQGNASPVAVDYLRARLLVQERAVHQEEGLLGDRRDETPRAGRVRHGAREIRASTSRDRHGDGTAAW